MRKVDTRIEDVIEFVKKLKGESVDLEVTRGRKKTLKISGTIESVYPSIFTVKTDEEKSSSFSCSYADVLCGVVKLTKQDAQDTTA